MAFILAFALLLTQFSFTVAAEGDDVIPNINVNDVEDIVLAPSRALIENVDGEWDTSYEDPVFYYDVYVGCGLTATVTLKDGSTVSGDYLDVGAALGNAYPELYDDQYEKPWGVGKHTVQYVIQLSNGKSYVHSMQVEVAASPIKSFSVSVTGTLKENVDGYQKTYGGKTFFYYNLDVLKPVYTVVYKDGSQFTGSAQELHLQTGHAVSISTGQNEKPWKVGKHTVTFEYTGITYQLQVEVVGDGPAVIYGDVNDDGKVNTKDLILLRQHLAGWDVTINADNADVTADGKVNTKDLILLRQYLAGWDVTLG